MNSSLTIRYPLTLILMLSFASGFVFAQDNPPIDGETDTTILNEIVTPGIERRRIKESQLDSEDWEIGIYNGIFSIEDFGSNSVTGLRLAYHMTEDFVVELSHGVTEAKESSIEVLGGIRLLTDEEREYTYYNVSLVYNMFPGEVFLGGRRAYNSSFYILAGAGNTTFNENDYFTYIVGGGLRFYFTDAIALHFAVKNHIFRNDIIEDKITNNLEGGLGLSFYF